jgi:hypothetical protein
VIQGNQSWQNSLAMLQKQPLYTVEIPAFGFMIASFTTAQTGVTTAGYGVVLYGAGGYGT